MPRPAFVLALAALALAGCGPHQHPHASALSEPSPELPRVSRPAAVLIIRHAEKPADADDPGLSPEGKKRADALPGLFRQTADRPDPFPTPDCVFATKSSKRSDRPAATVAPLAQALKLEVNAGYAEGDASKLAAEVTADPKYAGKTVLICWRHGGIPELAGRLGATGVPDKWADDVFDRVWVVTFDPAGRGKPLVSRPQALMPGDGNE